jgi:predicted GNAT family acetyltransferase
VHGSRIIAASCLSTDENAASHLLSGPCVLPEYRSRGLASILLAETLHQLQQARIPVARAFCLEGTTASKFVYPKFGSVREKYAEEPF